MKTKIDRSSTTEYKGKRYVAGHGNVTVVLDNEDLIYNKLTIINRKTTNEYVLDNFVLDCLYEVLRKREDENKD